MSEIINAFGINWKLLVVQIVNFGILLVILYYFLYKRVIDLLEDRREKINQGLLDAEDASIKSQKIDDEKDTVIEHAIEEGERLVKVARTKALNQEQSLVSAAHLKGEKVIAQAQKKAQEEQERILAQSQHELAKMATLSAAKILDDK